MEHPEDGYGIKYAPPAIDRDYMVTVMAKIIPGFPYPPRFCPFCQRQLEVINAIHKTGEEEIFKAIMICENPECGAFDEEAKKAYARVYYSCTEAQHIFEAVLLRARRIEKW